MFTKPTKIRSKAITQSAKGEQCTLRIPQACNHNSNTTVFAHLPGNKGTGTKNHDLFGVYACSGCHDWLDRRLNVNVHVNRHEEILRALQETQLRLVEKDLLEVR